MDAREREQYRAAIHGDREAFEMIIRTHSRTLFAIAYGILQNREEAEDVVQDSLVKAWKTLWRVRDPEKFSAWLATIARHRAHDVFRRRRVVPFTHQTIETNEPETTDSAAIDQQLHSALAAVLYGELSEDERRQLHTHLFDCAACRKPHQETKTMNKILEETLAQKKPSPNFEQRMLARLRNRVPQRPRLVKVLVDLLRLR